MPRCSLDPSEGEDAFCEAEPRPAKQGLNISVADIAQSGAKRPTSRSAMLALGCQYGQAALS